MLFANTTVENVKRLTEQHLKMYDSRLTSGSKMVNIKETKHLLDIWTAIKEKGYDYNELTEAEQNEILDALFAES